MSLATTSKMAQPTIRLADLMRAYPKLSVTDRLHMIIRWRVCPMPALERLVPDHGTIVDLGCGHGLFAQMLTRSAPNRRVIGVDLDAHKIALAQTLTFPTLEFMAGDIAALTIPPAQAVTILDVFYLVPYAVQEHLIAVCAQKLEVGGVIMLKEMAETPRWKLRLAVWEEKLAVNVLRITATTEAGSFYFRSRADWEALFVKLGFRVMTIPLDRGYYHPHVAFVAQKL